MSLPIDAALLNDRYAQYKKQTLKQLDNDTVDDALDDTSESEYSEFSGKETLFEEYVEDEDADYELDYELNAAAVDDVDGDDDAVDLDDTLTDKILRAVLTFFYHCKLQWKRILLLLTTISVIFYFMNTPSTQIVNIKSIGDISNSIHNLQWQINDLQNKNKDRLYDLRNYFDLKMDEMMGKFVTIDSTLDQLKTEHYELLDKLEALKIDGIDISHGKIPVILDSHNDIQLLPEFKEYLHRYIESVLQGDDIQLKFQLDYQSFIEDYINEIVNDKVGFMKRQEILQLITLQFQENKKKLIQEIKSFMKPSLDTIPQKLIPQLEVNRSKINYAQSSNGARIINYLSSPTFHTRVKSWFRYSNDDEDESSSPFIVLTSNQGFWKSSQLQTTLGIKFLEPIYINEFKYQHSRVLNGAMLTSCPKNYQVYIHTDDKVDLQETLSTNNNYYKVMECNYDLNGEEEQPCLVPDSIKTILVKSLVIKVIDNYGNEFFTSLNKFQIHGLTRFDLDSVDRLLGNKDIGEPLKRSFRVTKDYAV